MGNMVRVCGWEDVKHFKCTSRNECRNGTPFDHPHNRKFAKKIATDAFDAPVAIFIYAMGGQYPIVFYIYCEELFSLCRKGFE